MQSDGAEHNNKKELSLKFGPPGAQNGHPNPVGIPPTLIDTQVDYVSRCGGVYSFSVVPGLTYGRRYRQGEILYGDLGAGLMLSAQGLGPGFYAAVGLSFRRTNAISFDVEYKKSMALSLAHLGRITTPYALRVGLSYRW